MKIDVIMFDWGGTLAQVDGQAEAFRRGATEVVQLLTGKSDPALIGNLLTAASAAEARVDDDPLHREVDLRVVITDWAADQGLPIDDAGLASAVDAVGRNWVGALEPMAGAVDTLRTLRQGGFRMGLVSNCLLPPVYCRQELDRQGFGAMLDFSLFSSEVGHRKPSDLIYEEAQHRAFGNDRPADLSGVLFVGDSPAYDVVAPAQLGMKTALVKCQRGIWAADDYARAEPDLHINRVSELPAKLGLA